MPESQNTEWKSKWKDEYLEWICGYANAQGGKIYIGCDDEGNIVGLPNARKLLEDIPNKIRDAMGIIVGVNLLDKDGKEYIEIDVPPYPTESVAVLRRSKPFRPTSSSISSTARRTSFSSTFFRRRPKATFSNTFRCGNRAYFWNTVFTCRLYGGRCVMSLPSKKTLPDFGSINPPMTRSVVVLPQPE